MEQLHTVCDSRVTPVMTPGFLKDMFLPISHYQSTAGDATGAAMQPGCHGV